MPDRALDAAAMTADGTGGGGGDEDGDGDGAPPLARPLPIAPPASRAAPAAATAASPTERCAASLTRCSRRRTRTQSHLLCRSGRAQGSGHCRQL